jgi:hypothetical protein
MVPGAEQQSPAIEITLKQHPPKQPPPLNSIIISLNTTEFNLSPFNNMTGNLLKPIYA